MQVVYDYIRPRRGAEPAQLTATHKTPTRFPQIVEIWPMVGGDGGRIGRFA